MKHLLINYCDARIEPNALQTAQKRLENVQQQIKKLSHHEMNDSLSFVNLPGNETYKKQVQEVINQKKKLKPTVLIVIGIGGSNLGTAAIVQALLGTMYNELQPDCRIYFADTVDDDYIYDLILLVEQELEKNNTVLINIISKSGSTTETVANGALFIELLKKACPKNYQEYIVVTTDKDSSLWQIGKENNFTCLEIPLGVGGRYSVLTAVGLFPLGMISIDIDQLCAGAHQMTQLCLDTDPEKNPATQLATVLAHHVHHEIFIHDTFVFSVDLKGLGLWYRQLLAESLGKEFTIDGKAIKHSLVPTVSVGSIDLHSTGQLTLSGTESVVTTFVTVEHNNNNLTVPRIAHLGLLEDSIKGKTLHALMQAIYDGTMHAYKQRKLPFVSITLPEKNAWYIGQWLQCHMIAIVYLGCLLDINPFGQPNVELYKQKTREILANE